MVNLHRLKPLLVRFEPHPRHLKRYLLAWTLGPIALLMLVNAMSLYSSTLHTTAIAHDRLLKATAQQIADLLRVERDKIEVTVPLALIEALEGTGSSRMFYRVLRAGSRHVAGDTALWPPTGPLPDSLSVSYKTTIEGMAVNALALRQPVEYSQGQDIALILVAETREAREASAQALLNSMLFRQLGLLLLISIVTWLVVDRALQPLARLRNELNARSAHANSPIQTQGPHELQPVISALNQLLERQTELMRQQQRLIADASHQLRTPLAVLKTQLQSALSGDAPERVLLTEMLRTVDRSTHLANQLLSKARLEQTPKAQRAVSFKLRAAAQEAVLELSPLIAAKQLDFCLSDSPEFELEGQAWMAGELLRNLLSNAIGHTPAGAALGIRIDQFESTYRLCVWDSGPGLSEDMRAWIFQPFASHTHTRTSAGAVSGAGLGLSICADIARELHAQIELINRVDEAGQVQGLDAVLQWAKRVNTEVN